MSVAFQVNVVVHVLAALLWLGGMFFLAAVGAPVLRKVEDPGLRSELFRKIGEQFRRVGWASIVVLVVSGVGNLHFRGVFGALGEPEFWAGRYGRALAWKLGAVTVMLVIQAVHDFWLGPLAGRLEPESERAARVRTWAAWGGRVNALVGVVLVWAAVRLARGG